ncbi:MAG: ABC transporter permease, partial [Bacteroidales bacterium]
LKNRQYLIITLLEAPALAVLLSFYTRSSRSLSGLITDYTFGMNENLPAYLFMTVIVALFLGLVLSAEEIFRDRKILERERFLNLSRFSYLVSKISILFIISAIQMLLFVVIGNSILEICSMTWRYFLILFSASCWANLVGLNISAGFKSVVTIYILVPLILVPQLLFSGVVVDFHNLNKAIYNTKSVPLVGELMTSRWAYEALMVTQYKDNPFQKELFNTELVMSESMYKKAYVIPKLRSVIGELESGENSGMENTGQYDPARLLVNETERMGKDLDINTIGIPEAFRAGEFSGSDMKKLQGFLDISWKKYHSRYLRAADDKEAVLASLKEKFNGTQGLAAMENKYANNRLSEIVRNENELVEYVIDENEIIRMRDPVHTLPLLNNGRAHFYAPYKKVSGVYLDTFWFNMLVIWLSAGLWFVILYYDLLRKLIQYIENIQLQRFNRKIIKKLKQNENRQ